jgi:uncharacterized Tic20 family protein
MSLPDEIQKLRELHQSGALTDAEFASAKAQLLQGGGSTGPPPMPSAAVGYAAPVPAGSPGVAPLSRETATRQWALILHLSQFAGYLVPLAGFVAPIVIWQIKKKELPGLDAHGCHATNWVITEVIGFLICIPLCFIFIGVPLLIGLAIVGIIFPILAALKANEGEAWRYPLSFTFFKPQSEDLPDPPDAARPREW